MCVFCVDRKSKMITIGRNIEHMILWGIFPKYSNLKPMNNLKASLTGFCLGWLLDCRLVDRKFQKTTAHCLTMEIWMKCLFLSKSTHWTVHEPGERYSIGSGELLVSLSTSLSLVLFCLYGLWFNVQ